MAVVVPEELHDLFVEPALAHVSYLNKKGQIVTFPMWADYDGEHVLVSSPVGSKKGKALRERPHVAVSIVSNDNRWHWSSISGRRIDMKPDDSLEFIARMAKKDTGQACERRARADV